MPQKKLVFSWNSSQSPNKNFPQSLSGVRVSETGVVSNHAYKIIKAGFTALAPNGLARLFLWLHNHYSLGDDKSLIFMRLFTFYFSDQVAMILALLDIRFCRSRNYTTDIAWIDIHTSNIVNLKDNIAEYLADFRMVNDYVTIKDGRIINLGFEISVYTDKSTPKGEIMTDVIEAVNKYFDINKWDMGDNVYLAQLIENINNVGGVLNVTELKVFNKVNEDGKYSLNEISQPYSDDATKEIDISNDYTLFGEPDAMFEIKYPNKDIKVRFK